ncbi:MAG: DUF1566 domain-containing protein [Nitrospirae bacterium]|nr:DUF1566 domain-containing protein [Nitrospirota bacterium]MBF0592409.1 DUF1566 domain-containing protein [Nitrospirota bacterium]
MQSNNYWSSTSYANNTSNAWIVNMNDGNVNANDKSNNNYVWPVRSGEWLPPLFSMPGVVMSGCSVFSAILSLLLSFLLKQESRKRKSMATMKYKEDTKPTKKLKYRA